MDQNTSFTPETKKGYNLMEASSAFQKAVRRGLEDVALYFAVEMFNSNYGEYVWKRIKIISSEDIGLAEPNCPAIIQGLYQSYVEQVKKKDTKHFPERLFLVHAILYLCRAKKSRLIDWTLLYYWEKHDKEYMEIPDFAFDQHNGKGRRMGRSLKHFYEEGSQLSNHVPQDGEGEMRKLSYEEKTGARVGDTVNMFPENQIEETK